MASKTTGKDEEEFARQHHLFYDMGDEFEAQLTPYLSSPDKTLLRYIANITDGTTEATFERTKLVPKAALERAKRDDGFLYNFAHSIAFSYNEEILQSGKYVCKECGKPAVMVLQSPTTSLTDDDPPLIHDIMAMPLCGGQDCDIKAKNSFLGLIENFQELMKQVKETTDVDVNVNLDRDLPKTCLHCGKVDDSLLKCSRCKRAFFCDRDCQQ